VRFSLVLLAAPLLLGAAGEETPKDLAAPVRLEAAGSPIDTAIGHAAPCVTDWDGDGKKDLLVGQFGGGLLRIYRNEGSDAEPKLAADRTFQAGGKDGTVPTG
jgi:hypothetical protein